MSGPEPDEYIVWFDRIAAQRSDQITIEAGYYVGHIGMNQYIYGRGPKEKALKMSRHQAKSMIDNARRLGYPCKSDPPFIVKY